MEGVKRSMQLHPCRLETLDAAEIALNKLSAVTYAFTHFNDTDIPSEREMNGISHILFEITTDLEQFMDEATTDEGEAN